jgi:O-antigen ligase
MLLIGVLLSTAIMTNEGIAARFHQFKDPLSASNTSGRNQIYETAFEMIKEHPFTGIGTKNFRYVFKDYYPVVYARKEHKNRYDKKYLDASPAHTHSMFLSFLLNWGLIGTLFFIYILYQIYKKYVRNNEIALLASIGLLYCIAPFNFGNTIARSQWQFYIFLTLAFVVILARYRELQKNKG